MSRSVGSLGRLGVAPRLARVAGGQLADGALERRGEEQGLPLGRGLADDPVHRGLESHVEHAVGLVEDEDADVLQRDDTARDQVLEATRGGDEDVGAPRRRALGPEADAAVDGGYPELSGAGDGVQLGDDLARQLAGGGEHERGDVFRPRLDPVHQRQAEGKGLAGAGGRLDEQVVSRERVADDHLLDGKGLGDAALRKCAHDRVGDAGIGKRFDGVSSFLSG